YPVPDESLIDKTLEKDMEDVLDMVVLGRAARNESGIKNRQPIGKMYVKAKEMSDFYKQIILEELNVKSVEFSEDVRAFTTYTFKPQLKTVGPKFGKLLNKIREALTNLDGNEAMDTLKDEGALKFNFDGSEVRLAEEDLLIEMSNKEGFVEQSDNAVTVVLDTNLTPELLEEGYVRELISKIQTMRKEAGFEVMDKIRISMTGSEKLEEYLTENADFVKTETMASLIDLAGLSGYTKEWDINGERVTLGVEKID
ncbi:MAG: isoleucine--tRNA ligase, partial [Lachnospiraceae bacterium]|nr:isoleucine--tRNA ligase [Lachnospiraceae bacterium]